MVRREYFWFACEAFLVLMMIIVLKIWVFPFFISIWYPTDDVSSQMMMWTVLIISVITCFIYLGLGSSAKYTYGFSFLKAVCLFIIFHLPLFIPLAFLEKMKIDWLRLFGDFLFLFSVGDFIAFSLEWMILVYFLFFLAGRKVEVRDQKKTRAKLQNLLHQRQGE
ncbi:hypothetical protein [Thermoflavimicrobium daqui]|uniref:Uncharacterized protein n=1 Tax=Thermoflavimicrobium daqui TaxID=2137476 RepID=A0A364K2H2_9BACL|nr:hypothetical protein [Thermoflavimicrobium daqui]RAL22614.1 hypothetical protein DL897_13155 [Thermoflavimicrobium daqui]